MSKPCNCTFVLTKGIFRCSKCKRTMGDWLHGKQAKPPASPVKKSKSMISRIKEREWKTEDFKFGVDVLLHFKPFDKSITKAVEELLELSLKLSQYINKEKGSVTIEEITEEIADVEMHLYLLKHHFPVTTEMRKNKVSKFLNSKDYASYLALTQ